MSRNLAETASTALQPFEPDSDTVYTIETAAKLAQVPRRHIVVYFKHGLVSPAIDPSNGGWWFNDQAINALRRIEYLRAGCGINLAGIKLILELTKEVELLREQLGFLNRK